MISLGQKLNLRVIAEASNRASSLHSYARIIDDEMQGYYFSRPIPAEAITETLAAGSG